ncbi:MAG: lysophospholipid acyltransferase family protein [Bdellovibrio sp.]
MRDFNFENEQWTKLPSHLKHLPLFTRHLDFTSWLIRLLWGFFLKHIFFKTYIQLRVKGEYRSILKKHPKLILISNHSSHLDALSIASSLPFSAWSFLFIAAAKDYFFSNALFTFFSQHCLGAIPIDRSERKGEAVHLISRLLKELPQMWLILFPEGTRSRDGRLQEFKRGVSLFSQGTETPILFLYLRGNAELWPKGWFFARPGFLTIHIGPVQEPAPLETIQRNYQEWARQFEMNENS